MRSSGILMPISALPACYGIGTIGQEAYSFVDFLARGKQRYWQILPCGPTGYGDSPYQSFSAHAGNPYWIDLDMLVADGLLTRAEIKKAGFVQIAGLIDYGDLYEKRFELLSAAASRIDAADRRFLSFCEENSDWLGGYALFMALKAENGMEAFHKWPEEYRVYNKKRMKGAEKRLKDEIHYWSALQYLFFGQWKKFKAYANGKGVKIIGDIPIYVSPDSSDLWINYHLFQVDKNRDMTGVAGCPPDYFDPLGQRWGNPLYNWNYHKRQDYEWWIKRINHAGKLFDAVRIDHFRGFAGYYSIPAENETAEYGVWEKGPGKKLISRVKDSTGDFTIIAEDLGYLTRDVRALLKYSGFPGMKVLQFAFGGDEDNEYLPHRYTENCVVYTGTHDNTTTRDWEKTARPEEIAFARKYLRLGKNANLTRALVKAAMDSRAALCVIPIQDWLELGKEARVNTPGVPDGNWRFRVGKRALSHKLAEKIRAVTEAGGRAD